MIKKALRLITDSGLHPLAELFDTGSVDLPLEVFLLVTLVISIQCSRAKLLKQLAIFFIAQICILNDLFVLAHKDVVVLALLLIISLIFLCCLTRLIVFSFARFSVLFRFLFSRRRWI